MPGIGDAVAKIKDMMTKMDEVETACKPANLTSDLGKLLNWIGAYSSIDAAHHIVAHNIQKYTKDVERDSKDAKVAWAAREFFHNGTIWADITNKLLGPVYPPPSPNGSLAWIEEPELKMPIKAAPEFAAGFLLNFIEENNLEKIEACYTGGEGDLSFIKEAIKDFENGDSAGAIDEIKQFAAAMPALLQTCEDMKTDIDAIEAWAAIFKNKTALIAKVAKAMVLHKKAM